MNRAPSKVERLALKPLSEVERVVPNALARPLQHPQQPRHRARLVFFGLRPGRLYRAEIIGRLNFADRSVEEELEKLVALDLLETTRDGNRRYYAANRNHPWHAELCGLVLKARA